MFKKESYVSRRSALLASMADKGAKGIALFIGNAEAAQNYRGNDYKFRQDSSFLYFWGIDAPMFAAILDLESGEPCLYGDDVDIDDIIWMGPMPSVASMAASVGVTASKPYGDFDRDVLKAVAAGRPLHFLAQSRWYNAVKLSRLAGCSPEELFTAGKKGSPLASPALTASVIALRLVKSDEEIAAIDHACELGYDMHSAARRNIRVGRIEQEVVGAMEGVGLAGGWGTSFATILTQHGEIFHCHSHDCDIEEGKLMVVDAGVESNAHYASDFTRTYPTGGRFSAKQRDIYDIVCSCNELAFSLTRPGIAYRDVHLAVAEQMLDSLGQLGLVHGDPAEMAAEGVAGLFMPHGLGHNMGMDVHDMEDLGEDLVGYDSDQKRSSQLGLGSLRMARRLVPGNVLTDEPGIYFIPDLIELWRKEGKAAQWVDFDALRDYYDFGGIRLEDDVLVTADGARRLGSRRLPITSGEVEEAMRKDREL